MSALQDIEPTSAASAAWLPVLDIEQVLRADPILFPISLREIKTDGSLEIAFPEFGAMFGGPAKVDVSDTDFGRRVTSRITPNVDLVMELVGRFTAGQPGPCTEATVEIRQDAERRRALDVFVTSTLFALLGLSRRVDFQSHIPGVEPLIPLRFGTALSAISQYLKSRQIAYKVMAIERATHQQFTFPTTRSAVDVHTISFVYEAIVQRSFLWPDNYDGRIIPLPASLEGLNELLALKQERDLKFGPLPLTKTLFGKTLFLGVGTATVLDAIIDIDDESKEAMERGDGADVQVRIRSLSGRVRYDLPDAPRLTEGHWDRDVQALIDIEPLLDAALFERYNALAAGSLADLTEEEKVRVTASVDFAAAFLPREIYGDKTLWRRLLRFLRFR